MDNGVGTSRITLTRKPGMTVVVRHWFTATAWLTLFFGLAFGPLGAASLVYWAAAPGPDDRGLLMIFGGFAVFGCYLLYASLTMFLNSSSILLLSDRLFVTHGPLPNWLPRLTVFRDRIDCVIVTDRLWPGPSRYLMLALRSQATGDLDAYSVALRLKEGRDTPLLTGLVEADAASLGALLSEELGVESRRIDE